MSWFRNHVQIGTRLALLALALQLFLSFTHVHLVGFPQVQERSTFLAADDDGVIPKSPPAGRDPLCAICALIQLVGSSVCPVAPAADSLREFDSEPPEESAATNFSTALLLSFEARAPPYTWRWG